MRSARPGPRKTVREMTTWCWRMEKEVKSQPSPVRRPPMVAGNLGENLATRAAARGATSWEEAKPRAGIKVDKAVVLAYREERRRERTWKELESLKLRKEKNLASSQYRANGKELDEGSSDHHSPSPATVRVKPVRQVPH